MTKSNQDKKMSMVRTQVLFLPTQKQEIELFAAQQMVSFSEACRILVKSGLAKLAKPNRNAVEMLLAIADDAQQRNVTGPADLSTNDEYLYGESKKNEDSH